VVLRKHDFLRLAIITGYGVAGGAALAFAELRLGFDMGFFALVVPALVMAPVVAVDAVTRPFSDVFCLSVILGLIGAYVGIWLVQHGNVGMLLVAAILGVAINLVPVFIEYGCIKLLMRLVGR
jgi:Na+/melibiose symporter-like transporter